MATELHTISVIEGSSLARADRVYTACYVSLPYSIQTASLTASGSTTAGTGYTTVPTLAFTGGTGSGGTAAIPSLKVVAATVAAGGTGHVTNDVVSFGNGVTLTATASAGVVTSWAITTAGAAQSAPQNPVAQVSTTGAGIGATVTLVWGLNSAIITNGGNYSVVPTGVTVTGGGGTSGAVAAPVLGHTGSAGDGVVVGVTGAFPAAYTVQATPSVPAIVSIPFKSTSGFSVLLTPLLVASTLAAGTVDIEIRG